MFSQPSPQTDFERLRLAQSEQVRKHYQSRETAVLIPALQSFVTALAVSGLAGVIWVGLKLPYALLVTPGVFLLVFLLTWLARLADWRSLVWTLESALHQDFDGDGQQGEPEPPQTVRVELHSEDDRHIQFADIPTSQEKMADLARGVLGGTPFTETAWSGAGALFSRDEFRRVRSAFMSRGWLRWKDERYPQQGVELAPAGKAVLRTFASDTPPLSTYVNRKP